MKISTKSLLLLTLAALLLALGGGIGWRLALRNVQPEPIATDNEPKILYWYDPMMPLQHFDRPGPSPFMDMPLIAKYADNPKDSNEETAPGLSIDSTVTQNIGLRLATVTRIPLSRRIEATGVIAFNERDIAIVQTRSGGFVERAWPLAVGDVVKAGQPLAKILAPEWAAAQQELLAVRGFNDKQLLGAAHQRLLLQGMPEKLIRRLEQTGAVQTHYTIGAPIAGVIQTLEVRNGMTLSHGQTLAQINGLSSVWLEVAVPEAQADAVRIGDSATVWLTAFPKRSIEGRVTTILPMLNASSRSVRVRVALKNPQQQLRPGLSAQVTLSSASQDTALAVPSEALIRTGKRTLVMVAGKQGRYTPQHVTVGHEIGNQTVISQGLKEGQQVVASGQFLIDSEASLNSIEARSADLPTDGAQ